MFERGDFAPDLIVFLPKGVAIIFFAYGRIQLSTNIDVILASIQRTKFLTLKNDLEPPAYIYRGILKSHSTSVNANANDIDYHSIFALVSPTTDATSSTMVIISTVIGIDIR